MKSRALRRYQRIHLAWRQWSRVTKALHAFEKELKLEERRLAQMNDAAFARLSAKDKEHVQKVWLPTLTCRRCGSDSKTITGPPIIQRCADCGLPWGMRPS